jgi:hypothetical protein
LRLNLAGLIELNRRVVFLVCVLVLLDAASTYLCTLFYPVELEFNPILRALLLRLGRVAIALYAPLEFALLVLLLSAYSRILARIGVGDTFKYCVAVVAVLSAFVAMNFAGVLHAVLSNRP